MNEVLAVVFSPDGKRIVSGSDDSTIKIWDAQSGKVIQTLHGHTTSVNAVAFSPDGKYIVSGSYDKTIKIWDAQSGESIQTLRGHAGGVIAVTFCPEGKRIVSGSDDRTIKIWDVQSGEEIQTLRGHAGGVIAVTFSPEGKRIVSGSDDSKIKIWDAQSGEVLQTLLGHTLKVTDVAFSPDGKRIISGSYAKTIKIWDAQCGEVIQTLHGHTAWVNAVAFSYDGKRIVSGSYDKTIRIWDAQSGQEIQTLREHNSWVNAVAFSPDGKQIVSGSGDRTIKIWDSDIYGRYKILQTLQYFQEMEAESTHKSSEDALASNMGLTSMEDKIVDITHHCSQDDNMGLTSMEDKVGAMHEKITPQSKRDSTDQVKGKDLEDFVTFNRYSDVSMPGSVPVGTRFPLKVLVTLQKLSPEALELPLRFPEGEREVRVSVYVAAQGLEIDGDHLKELIVPPDRDSDPVFFHMLARQSGACSATVEFVQDGRYLGGVTVETVAYEASEFRSEPSTRGQSRLDFEAWQIKPDAMLFIHEVKRTDNEVRYRFVVDSLKLGLKMKNCGEASFYGRPSRWMNRVMAELNKMARDTVPKAEINKILAGFGVNFYEELFPQALKNLYWEKLRGNVISLVIISEEPWIPWEIIKPTGRNDSEPSEDPHLCESFSIARWLSGNGTPRTELHITNAAVIAPEDSGLSNRHLEVRTLKNLTNCGIDVVEISAIREQILMFCESPGRNLVHFVGHNFFDRANPDLSSILLCNSEPLFPTVINGERAKFLREARPLLFFNACHSARTDFNPVGIGGWAKTFLKEGASAFIGPFWEVVDDSALKLAQKFYSELLDGTPIGEALRQARMAVKDRGDPTWLSYSLYAHPEARFVGGRKQK